MTDYNAITEQIEKHERFLGHLYDVQKIGKNIEKNHGNFTIDKVECDRFGEYLEIITETVEIDPVRDLLNRNCINVEKVSWNNGTIVFVLRLFL